jgi:hypothetical protein
MSDVQEAGQAAVQDTHGLMGLSILRTMAQGRRCCVMTNERTASNVLSDVYGIFSELYIIHGKLHAHVLGNYCYIYK